jgi:hypothetical protein
MVVAFHVSCNVCDFPTFVFILSQLSLDIWLFKLETSCPQNSTVDYPVSDQCKPVITFDFWHLKWQLVFQVIPAAITLRDIRERLSR